VILDFEIHHESEKPLNAEKAVRGMKKGTGASFKIISAETYLNKGSVVRCRTMLPENDSWESTVFNILQLAQSYGRNWTIASDVSEELDMHTSSFHHGSGVTFSRIYHRNK